MFKLIIAGGRDFNNSHLMAETLNEMELPEDTELVCGMARGADLIAKELFDGIQQPVKEFPANWKGLGRIAGYVRNNKMADYADALVAFWDGKSHGTKHMIETMEKLSKPVTIISYE